MNLSVYECFRIYFFLFLSNSFSDVIHRRFSRVIVNNKLSFQIDKPARNDFFNFGFLLQLTETICYIL